MLKCVVEDLGAPELLLPCLLRTAYPSYGYFLARQETAWPEYWGVDGEPSRIHTCYTSVAGYFIRGIGGIQPDPQCAGMQRFVVRPFCPDSLSYARTHTASLYGAITCNWFRHGQQMTLELLVPPNTQATVHLPAPPTAPVTESGQPLNSAAGITRLNAPDERPVVRVASGQYSFVWNQPATD
jgi:alpha-L-rhamnosidase